MLRFNFITGLFLSLSGLLSNVGGREGREGRPGGPSPSLLSSLSWLLSRWSGYSLPLLFPSSLNLLPASERARLRENIWSVSRGAGETVAMPVNLSALTALKTRGTKLFNFQELSGGGALNAKCREIFWVLRLFCCCYRDNSERD